MINLEALPSPDLLPVPDPADIVDDVVADLQATGHPAFADLNFSDPTYKIIEAMALREVAIVQRFNHQARQLLITTSSENNLEILGANVGVKRKITDPGDPTANPPIPPTYEDLDVYRDRVAHGLDGYSTAGPISAYRYHALAAEDTVKDAHPISPVPTEVEVYLLSYNGIGQVAPAEVAVVQQALSSDEIRPLTDIVTVKTASIQQYQIEVTIYSTPGPEQDKLLADSKSHIEKYADTRHFINNGVYISAIQSAASVSDCETGQSLVTKVEVTSPSTDLPPLDHLAYYCSGVTVNFGGYIE